MNVQKKFQFGFRLGLNAIKELRRNAVIKKFSAFSSTVHLHSKKLKRFSVDAFVLCCHKVFSFIVITVPVHQRDTLIKLRDHLFVCRLRSFFSWLLRRKKKN